MCALTAGTTLSSHTRGHILPEVWRRVLEVAPAVGHLNVNGWGENFANPRFLSLLEEVEAAGVEHNFSTNGALVTPEAAARMARMARLRVVNVSMDSTDAEAYRAIRGGDVHKALRGLSTLLQALGPDRVTVSFLVNQTTVDALPAAGPVMASLGARHLVLQSEVDSGIGHGDFPERAADVVTAFARDCNERGIDVLIVPFLRQRMEKPATRAWAVGEIPREEEQPAGGPTRQCTSPWEHVFVDKDGRVFPCCNCPPLEANGDTVMGDLRRQSFEEVWNGERFRSFRRQLVDGPPPPVCRRCEVTSWGVHFYKTHAARIRRIAYDPATRRVRLKVKNRGREPWGPPAPLRVGTMRPRDRRSELQHASWLGPDRTCEAGPRVIAPGQSADLEFTLEAGESGREWFQLLLEGVAWLPETEFWVDPAAHGEPCGVLTAD